MTQNGAQRVAAGSEALASGDLAGATAAFTAAAEVGNPLGHLQLGKLCYADDRLSEARSHWETAYRGLRDGGDLRAAASCAILLVDLHASALGNVAAGRGWAGRASRLLDQVGACVEWGYLQLAKVGCDVPDIESVERSASSALEMAIQFGDSDLEVRALADSGLALVCEGRLSEGFARLDEAMAAITAGEVQELSVAGKSFCAMLTACERAGDAGRAEEWTRLVMQLMIDPLGGRPRVLYTHCRSAYGSVLCGLGRWDEAEVAMLDALGASSSFYHQAQASAHLADLRLLQGRCDEAAEILRPFEDRIEACGPLSRLYFIRGQFDLAAAVLERALGELIGDRLRQAPLLGQLVEVELARDDVAAAERAAERLAAVAGGSDSPALAAESALAGGRMALARSEAARAVALLEEARRLLSAEERPLLCGAVRYELAVALRALGDMGAATHEARAALSVFERLGSTAQVDRTAALLRSLGAPGRLRKASADGQLPGLTARESDVLDLVRSGLTNAEIGGRLYISAKTAEHHVGRILTKLGVRSRAEAAALAVAASRRTHGAE